MRLLPTEFRACKSVRDRLRHLPWPVKLQSNLPNSSRMQQLLRLNRESWTLLAIRSRSEISFHAVSIPLSLLCLARASLRLAVLRVNSLNHLKANDRARISLKFTMWVTHTWGTSTSFTQMFVCILRWFASAWTCSVRYLHTMLYLKTLHSVWMSFTITVLTLMILVIASSHLPQLLTSTNLSWRLLSISISLRLRRRSYASSSSSFKETRKTFRKCQRSVWKNYCRFRILSTHQPSRTVSYVIVSAPSSCQSHLTVNSSSSSNI